MIRSVAVEKSYHKDLGSTTMTLSQSTGYGGLQAGKPLGGAGAAVQLVEDSIWRALSRLAETSADYRVEIASLVHHIQNHVSDVSSEDTGWFAEGHYLLCLRKRKHNQSHATKTESPVARGQAEAGIMEYVDLTVKWSPLHGNLSKVAVKTEPSKAPTMHELYGASNVTLLMHLDCHLGKPQHISHPQSSVFHLMKYEDFQQMSTKDIQACYRTRHRGRFRVGSPMT
ncbi:hypothetical protein JOM56_012773 [Amanita muscaria]